MGGLRTDCVDHLSSARLPFYIIYGSYMTKDMVLGPAKDMFFVGKDYSNPRIVDFHTLTKPFEDMYDRAKIPRMPW